VGFGVATRLVKAIRLAKKGSLKMGNTRFQAAFCLLRVHHRFNFGQRNLGRCAVPRSHQRTERASEG